MLAAGDRIVTSLPWWMGVALVVVWLAVVVAAVAIARRRFGSRRRPPTMPMAGPEDARRRLSERSGPRRELPPAP